MGHQVSCVQVIIHHIVVDGIPQVGWERGDERRDNMIQLDESWCSPRVDGFCWVGECVVRKKDRLVPREVPCPEAQVE